MTGTLRETGLPDSVQPDDRAVLVAVSRLRAFRRGQLPFMTGDVGDTLVVDVSSRVKVVARAADGSELRLGVVGPGFLAATLRWLTEVASYLAFLHLLCRVAKVLPNQPRGNDGIIRLTMTQEELLRQARSKRPSVNAALPGFEWRGWIAAHNRAVTVTQESAPHLFTADLL